MNVRKFKWLIVIVVHEFTDETNQHNLNEVINREILKTGINDHHALLIVYKSIRHKPKYRFRTRIVELEKAKTGKFRLRRIKKVDFDFHNERSWLKLMQWIAKYYTADYICLNTISHGAGFGIVSGEDDDKIEFGGITAIPGSIMTQAESSDKIFLAADSFYKGNYIIKTDAKSSSCRSLQMLWISELSNALSAAFGQRKIDLLLFNNCYMQTYENAWMLSNNVNYIGAAETQFFSYGFNYRALLERINNDIRISPEGLIKTIIPDLELKWKQIANGRLEDICISILNINYIRHLTRFFEKIAIFLSELPDEDICQIILLRQNNIRSVTTYPNGGGSKRVLTVDLSYFLHLVADKYKNRKDITKAVENFKKMLIKIINRNIRIGENLILHDNSIAQDKYGATGLSIFVPFDLAGDSRTDVMNCAYFGRVSRNETVNENIPLMLFKKESQWDDFIEKILNQL